MRSHFFNVNILHLLFNLIPLAKLEKYNFEVKWHLHFNLIPLVTLAKFSCKEKWQDWRSCHDSVWKITETQGTMLCQFLWMPLDKQSLLLWLLFSVFASKNLQFLKYFMYTWDVYLCIYLCIYTYVYLYLYILMYILMYTWVF
jgi:hypothetical protein